MAAGAWRDPVALTQVNILLSTSDGVGRQVLRTRTCGDIARRGYQPRSAALTNCIDRETLMSLWLVRKDLFGDLVGAALCIADPEAADRTPAELILDAFSALHLADGERLQPGNHRLWIDHQ